MMSDLYRNLIPQHFYWNGVPFENACFDCPLHCSDCIFGHDHPFYIYPLESVPAEDYDDFDYRLP